MKCASSITRRSALGLLGLGAVGGAVYGLSRSKFLAFLRSDAETPEDFRVVRRPYPSEPGREVSVLGYGGIRLPILNRRDDQIDEELGLSLVDYAYRHGVNYFDTGWVYHKGEGERFFGRALRRYPRESFMLADKMPTWLVTKPEDAPRFFEEQLKRCQVDYFDNYLLHSLNNPEEYRRVYKEWKALDYLKEQKARGRIRHLGFSFHGKSALLKEVLDEYPWEMCVITLNALDQRWSEDSAKQIALLQERKVPMFIMEPLGGGRCANLNPAARKILADATPGVSPAEWAFRWALSQDGVQTVMSGMGRMDWLVENVRSLSAERFHRLSSDELAVYGRAIDAYMKYATVPCTGCRYCVPCPYGVQIPEVFAWWNSFAGAGRLPSDEGVNDSQELRREFLVRYSHEIAPGCGPEKCIRCRKCKVACPQWVFDIPTEMGKIDAALAKVRDDYVAKGGRL